MYPCSVAQKRQLRQHLAADERKGLIGLSGPTADEQMIGSANRSELSLVTIVPLFLFADQSFALGGRFHLAISFLDACDVIERFA